MQSWIYSVRWRDFWIFFSFSFGLHHRSATRIQCWRSMKKWENLREFAFNLSEGISSANKPLQFGKYNSKQDYCQQQSRQSVSQAMNPGSSVHSPLMDSNQVKCLGFRVKFKSMPIIIVLSLPTTTWINIDSNCTLTDFELLKWMTGWVHHI